MTCVSLCAVIRPTLQVLLLLAGDVLEACVAAVRQLKGITATYRMTAKGPPVRHSHYVAGGQPLVETSRLLDTLLGPEVMKGVSRQGGGCLVCRNTEMGFQQTALHRVPPLVSPQAATRNVRVRLYAARC